MKRRDFIAALGGTAAWPFAARAQQGAIPVIGFLNGQSPGNFTHLVAAFHEGLGETGYVEGRNVAVEYRWAGGDSTRVPALAAELVRQQVAVIVATGGAHKVAKAATSTIPIVCSMGGDPIKEGMVSSINKPGGNVTGASVFSATLEAKRLEMLHELVPRTTLIAVIIDSAFPESEEQAREVESAARAMARQILVLRIRTEADIDAAFVVLQERKVGAVCVGSGPFTNSRRGQFVARAAQYAIPAIYENRETVAAGGLMSYGANVPGIYRQIGVYTARILKGEKRRSAGAAADEIRHLHQLKDCESAGHRGANIDPAPRC